MASLPAHIGPYEVLELLGKGGMGAVYRARHRELDVVRALKVLLRPDEPTAAARFEREARALAAVRHPGVVGVHEVGAAPDARGGAGLLYLAMDLVEGEPLDRLLSRGGRLEVRRALELVADAAEGVGALHAGGIVHRDLKPENLVVTPAGRAVVIDLGLAQVHDAQRLTKSGAVTGTMSYLAPEQLEGRATARTDVHALGLILHEALTGAPPLLDGDSNQAVLARILSESRPRPGALRPELPAAIDDLVLRATARDPADRFADARELARALRVAALAPGGPTMRQRRARRFALRAAGIAVVGAVAIAGAATLATRPDGEATPAAVAPASPPDAIRPATTRTDDAAEARRELERARRLPDPAARAAALRAWAARWPAHPDAGPARAQALAALRDHPRWVLAHPRLFSAGFSGAGDEVVTVGRDGQLRVWAVGSLVPRAELALGVDVTAAAFVPDGPVIVGTATNDLYTFDPALAQAAAFGHTRPSEHLALSPDGRWLAVAAGRGVAVCTPQDGVAARHLLLESPVVAVAFEPGGLLLTGSGAPFRANFEGDNALRGWDPDTGKERFRLDVLTRCDSVLVLPGTARRAVVGTNAGTLGLVDLATGELTSRLARASGGPDAMLGGTQALLMGIFGLACTPDGAVLFACSDDHDVTQVELVAWDLRSGKELRRLTGRPASYRFAEMSRDGRSVLCGGPEGLELWDVEAFIAR